MVIPKHSFLTFFSLLTIICGSQASTNSTGACSYHRIASCVESAQCIDTADGGFECRCPENVEGDGMKNGTGCSVNQIEHDCSRCHSFAHCVNFTCVCNDGYTGNGMSSCEDINECKTMVRPCHQKAICQNRPGNYSCTCDLGYEGDGFNSCEFVCETNADCDDNAKCVNKSCVCLDNYQGDGFNCTDKDECSLNISNCHEHAKCINNIGSYTCECKNGYTGNGLECKALPINCFELMKNNPTIPDGHYNIDPDHDGNLPKIMVYCKRTSDGAETYMYPKTDRIQTSSSHNFSYENSVEQIRKVANNSGYCYQEISTTCMNNAKQMSTGSFWVGGDQEKYFYFPGANIDEYCTCGQAYACFNTESKCNCDGSVSGQVDKGKVIDKTKLPVIQISLEGLTGSQRMDIFIGAVVCANKPPAFPKDCHDAKFNHNKKKSEAMFIQPTVNSNPILVFCDMSQPDIGITVVHHDREEASNSSGPLKYAATDEDIRSIIDNSEFCRQDVNYTCINSTIMKDRNTQFTDINNNIKDYWPGGKSGGCACEKTGSCDDQSLTCNCDLVDGKMRNDFGAVTNKSDLPVGKVITKVAGVMSLSTIGPLKCGTKPFGYPSSCQGYFNKGEKDNNTYYILPQDKVNAKPFAVECVMKENPPHAVTILHHLKEEYFSVNGSYRFDYYGVTVEQIIALKEVVAYCQQTVSFKCNGPGLPKGSVSTTTWTDNNNNTHDYFNVKSVKGCACATTNSCAGGASTLCNCDKLDNTLRHDHGTLGKTEDLPVATINGDITIHVGPMECQETFPNCGHLYNKQKLPGDPQLYGGDYAIDVDGPGGQEPFRVNCQFPYTVIKPVVDEPTDLTNNSPNETVSKCFKIKYGDNITPEQIKALIDNSAACSQYMVYKCVNAEFKDKVHYKSIDNRTQTGWAGSKGEDKCKCGTSGTCLPEKDNVNDICNCQIQDNAEHSDDGFIIDKELLAVGEVCITLDPISPNTVSMRTGSFDVAPLYCTNQETNYGPGVPVYTSCQDMLDKVGFGQSDTVYLNNEDNNPQLARCEITAVPPMGVLTMHPKERETSKLPENETIIIHYYVNNITKLLSTILKTVYCQQEIYLLCNNVTKPETPVDDDDFIIDENDVLRCRSSKCACHAAQVHGGIVKVTKPVQMFKVPDNGGIQTRLYVGPTKCFEIYKDCDEILKNQAAYGWRRRETYAIDVNGPGGLDPFQVTCDFKTETGIGITIIDGTPNSVVLKEKSDIVSIEYPHATDDQINELTTQSQYCSQSVKYKCKGTPLSNVNVSLYNSATTSFGTGDHLDVPGCACMLTDTCPNDKNCHCDAESSEESFDSGVFTTKDNFPIQNFKFNLDVKPDSTLEIGDLRCGPRPFDLPKTCQEVRDKGITESSEYMIQSSKDEPPFFVYCDMHTKPGFGITIISPVVDHVVFDKTNTSNITYHDANTKQVSAVVKESYNCYMPVRADCKNSTFIAGGNFYWTGPTGIKNFNFGSGQDGQCTCANDHNCGGNATREIIQNRLCNCDAKDSTERRDGGIFSEKSKLPVTSLHMINGDNEYLGITLGNLYCSQTPLDLNPCTSGYHDCHEHAKCLSNNDGTFRCRCRAGWRGKGTDKYANGRDCHDDNECSLNICSYYSTCENTEGSYRCHCYDGFRKGTSERECIDIDECKEGTHKCDPNAECRNIPGSYDCMCKRGYRGNGTHCTALGECQCFGDPHCRSFDGKVLHFQGKCQYIMSQDGCDGTNRTFQVLTEHWDKNIYGIDATWVKRVTLKTGGHTLVLDQGIDVLTDGVRRQLPVYDISLPFIIKKKGARIEVITKLGLILYWDGNDYVEVNMPPALKDKICGLCGNYNDMEDDDWNIGPGCPGQEITETPNKFGYSYVDESYPDLHKCNIDCDKPVQPPCSTSETQYNKKRCEEIFNEQFKNCTDKMDEKTKSYIMDSCVFDACVMKHSVEEVLCNYTKNYMVPLCQSSYKTVITDWENEQCESSCEEGKVYLPCQNENNTLTCGDSSSNLTQPEYMGCIPGCYCKEGLVMDGDKCVQPEQCGCMNDQMYYSVGKTYVDENCTYIYTCESDKTFSRKPITCNENATCTLEDGFYGCHCNRGFTGNGTECKFDPCAENPCGQNSICIVNGNSYICECKMGFQGNCEFCDDIDECATRTHDCPPHSRCQNIPGNYSCKCVDGYRYKQGRCIDVNECDLDLHNCGSDSKCFNTPGKFTCVKCEARSLKDNQCCACHGFRCKEDGKVCGTDGFTHNSMKDLIIARCVTGKKIYVDYKGECQDNCDKNDTCPLYQTCKVKEINNKNTAVCVCEECSEEEINKTEKVCSNKFDLYQNICEFKKLQCKMNRQDIIIQNTTSPCKEKYNEDIIEHWTEWSPCSVTCGNGTKSRSRRPLINFDDYLTEKYQLNMTTGCYEPPCLSSACYNASCNASQVCVESGSYVDCVCPDCTDHGDDPVCGKIKGHVDRTYKNPCELHKTACEEGKPFDQLYTGKCGTKPVNCTVMPKYTTIKDGTCRATNVNIGKCEGGCGQYSDTCCKPAKTNRQIMATCDDESTASIPVSVIDSCSCIPEE